MWSRNRGVERRLPAVVAAESTRTCQSRSVKKESRPRKPPARGDRLTHVVVLGSTGSIGRSTLDVIEHDGGKRLAAWGFSAHRRWQALAEQARRCDLRYVVAADQVRRGRARTSPARNGGPVLGGLDGLIRMVQDPETDRVLSAIVGAVGLRGTWAALEAGKIVALANKETLVVAGPLVMNLAKSRGTQILPVDSEHSAIFQAKQCGCRRARCAG